MDPAILCIEHSLAEQHPEYYQEIFGYPASMIQKKCERLQPIPEAAAPLPDDK